MCKRYVGSNKIKWLIIMKTKIKIRNRSHGYDIFLYLVYSHGFDIFLYLVYLCSCLCLSMMVLTYIKQHSSHIGSSIQERVKQS